MSQHNESTWTTVVKGGIASDNQAFTVETTVWTPGPSEDGNTVVHNVTRTFAEVNSLFEVVRDKFPIFCFCVRAPLKHGTATDRQAALSYAQLFLSSVLAVPALKGDTMHVRPFFVSVFKYVPETFTPASLVSRRSAGAASVASFVFSKRKEDVDVFFDQAKAHILAVYAGVKDVLKDLDILAGMQIEYAQSIHNTELRLTEYSMHENDSVAVQVRKLAKFFHALEAASNTHSQFIIANMRQRIHAHTRTLKCMKVALEARLVALDEYEDACKGTQKKQQQLEKVGGPGASASSLSRVQDLSVQEIHQVSAWESWHKQLSGMFVQAKSIEDEAKERLLYVSGTIKENYANVRLAQGSELQSVLNDYAKSQLKMNTEVLDAVAAWV